MMKGIKIMKKFNKTFKNKEKEKIINEINNIDNHYNKNDSKEEQI